MKKLKSLLSLSLVLLLITALCGSALADVLPEPPLEDAFYSEHASEFVSVNISFYVSSASGASSYAFPGGAVRGNYKTGDRFYVYNSYTDPDGIVWLQSDNGYFKSSDCEEVYTSVHFKREHADSISPYKGDSSQYVGATEVVFWTYPNSGEYFYVNEYPLEEAFTIDSVYTDENGRLWGNVGYYFGTRDFWVSLSDLDGTGEVPVASATPTQPPAIGETPQTSDGAPSYIVIAIIMVVALAGITLLIIFGTKKKKDK